MRRSNRIDQGEDFWPAYTDILMVVSLILVMLVITFVLSRPDTRIREEQARRKEIFATAFKRAMDADIREGLASLRSPPGETQVITFSDQLLFDSGDADLRKPRGQESLTRLASLMENHLKLKAGPLFETIVVNGHTDEDPIKNSKHASNWHLSSARATSVVYFFQALRIPPKMMSATGYAEHRPWLPVTLEPITTKARKRRIEVVLSYPEPFIARQMGVSP